MAEKKVAVKSAPKKVKTQATVRDYDILRKPIISEKVARLAEKNGIAFEIDARATKKDVAKAILAIYNVAPEKVNIVNVKGKVKTFRGGSKGAQKTIKKAYVKMPADAKVDIATA